MHMHIHQTRQNHTPFGIDHFACRIADQISTDSLDTALRDQNVTALRLPISADHTIFYQYIFLHLCRMFLAFRFLY